MLRLGHIRCCGRLLPLLRHISSSPVQRARKLPPRDQYLQHTQKMFMDDLIVQSGRRPIQPLVESPIIAKKFFCGLIDNEQLMYPEVLQPAEFEALNNVKWEIDDYVHEQVLFDERGVTADVHAEFRRRNMYGYNVPKQFGGLGYRVSELAMLSEPEGQNVSVAMPLNAHRQACEIIDRFCTDELRAKYLPRLAMGELVATVAFDEWHEDELRSVKTIADVDDDTDEWILKGAVWNCGWRLLGSFYFFFLFFLLILLDISWFFCNFSKFFGKFLNFFPFFSIFPTFFFQYFFNFLRFFFHFS